MRQIITKQDDKFYRMGKELSDKEVLRMLNEYDYAVHTRTLNEREQLFRERAVKEHLVRENRILIRKIHELAYRGSFNEDDIVESLAAIDDDIFAKLQKTQLENEELKKELYLLKH